MSIDPDELKFRRIKSEQLIHEIQNYMEEQDALEKENATGKIGHREVKQGGSPNEKINRILKKTLDLLKEL
ncbi:MAG: hypothetical protein WB791_01360 [Waddliaceae bacterium]